MQRRRAEQAQGRQLCGLQVHLLWAGSGSVRPAALLAVVLVLPVSKGSLLRVCLAKLHLRGMGADAGGDGATASLQFPLCLNLQHSTWM